MNFLFGLRVGSYRAPAPEQVSAEYPARRRRHAGKLSGVLWTIRRDWPNGTHDFVGLEAEQIDAALAWSQMVHQLRGFSHRPRMCVVPISGHDFLLHAWHRPNCKAPDCPTVADVVPA